MAKWLLRKAAEESGFSSIVMRVNRFTVRRRLRTMTVPILVAKGMKVAATQSI